MSTSSRLNHLLIVIVQVVLVVSAWHLEEILIAFRPLLTATDCRTISVVFIVIERAIIFNYNIIRIIGVNYYVCHFGSNAQNTQMKRCQSTDYNKNKQTLCYDISLLRILNLNF